MLKEKIRRYLVGRLVRLLQFPRVAMYSCLSSNKVTGKPWRIQPLQAVGRGRISFAGDVKIGVFPSPYFFSTYAYIEARNDSSSIHIGTGTWINNNICIIAEHTSISIGEQCLIGANVEILDSDFHGIRLEERRMSRAEWARPIAIGNSVFIGSNVTILKGVTIGDGAVIANGSLVTGDIPAGVIAAGSPAKVIRAIP